jgi:hypothetical protein
MTLTDIVNPITDTLGLTDSEAGKRASRAMKEGQARGNRQLAEDTSESFQKLSEAMSGRDFGTNLDQYGQTMSDAMGRTSTAGDIALAQKDAGRSENVYDYLNPMMDEMLARTNQTMQGNAGAALQSSATNKDISRAVSSQAGNLWQNAFSNAMADQSGNLNVASNYGKSGAQLGGLAGEQLAAQNQPMEDYLSLKNDLAMQKYAANTGMTMAQMQLEGQPQTIL